MQRVRDGADQACRCAARQLRVRVECEYVTDLTQCIQTACFDGECIEFSGQELIEIEKLAALALPTHPNALACAKNAMTVKKNETAASRRAIFCVEFIDKLTGKLDEQMAVACAWLSH
jgi:hypothetical protein